MNVVQINALYGEKSTGVIVRDIDHMLKEHGHESFCVSRNTNTQDNCILIGNALDYSFHALRTRIDGKQGFSSRGSTTILVDQLKKLKPDILHLHNLHSNYINLPVLFKYARENSIPVILTLHDCWFFTGKCYHFADIGCEKWKTGCGNCPKRNDDIPSIISDSSAKVWRRKKELYDGVILYVVGCSQWISKCAKLSPLFQSAEILYIRNGVDLNVFSPKARENNGRFRIMTMANKWFLPGNVQITKEIIDSIDDKEELLIVGCKDEQLDAYSGIKGIKTLGYITDNNELASLYSSSDLFLNLTNIDNLPTVNMEAAACGTPVITYDSGGSGELVCDGITGFIVAPGNKSQLQESMEKVRNGIISRQKCREYALIKFNNMHNYFEYLKLYRRIVSNA